MKALKETAPTWPGVLVVALATVLTLLMPLSPMAWAAKSWSDVARETGRYLDQAAEAYRDGKSQEAKTLVDKGYFGPFESDGMEATIKNYISAQRAFELEQEFKQMKILINAGASPDKVEALATKIGDMLDEDAATLDGGKATESASSTSFLQSLIIIVREGFEAILIISALAAYLVKSGNREKVRTVYSGAGLALLASVATAFALQSLFSSGNSSQEVLEGATMLLAVAVLFWVSFWLTGKAQAQKWQQYIEGKVKASLTTGSAIALGAAAFLAVYREGAETILFYSALISGNPAAVGQVALGFLVGSLALVGIFVALKYGSVRIPIKQFFIATGVLLYYLAFTFAGQGMRELQEAGVVGSTVIRGVPVVDLFGIYPTLQTLSLQAGLILAALGGLAWQVYSGRKAARQTAVVEAAGEPGKTSASEPGRPGLIR